eukprot:4575969-Pyramimonas_sp.AAC.1
MARVALRCGLAVLGMAVVGQGLVETLLLTPVTWEITLVILAIAIASDKQNTVEVPNGTTDNPTRVQAVDAPRLSIVILEDL